MPYTFLHPGFVLPFARWFPRFLSIPALIMGSFVPDLDIIYRFSETRYHIFSYSTTNILFELLPIGIILTYYFKLIILPISKDGTIDLHPKNYLQHFKELPKIATSVLLAIGVHLFLDQYVHFNDAQSLSSEIGQNLGYEPADFNKIYLILLYLPQVIASGIGLILMMIMSYVYRKETRHYTHFLQKNWLLTIILSGLIMLSFTSMKVIKVGIEHRMQMDSILIGITCGLMSAFLLTPITLWILQKIKLDSRITLPSIFIISIYMLGLPVKEFLAIYILKGVFIVFISIIALAIIAYIDNKKILYLIILDFILSLIHPFTNYFTFLLLFKSTLFIGLYLSRQQVGTIFKDLLIGIIYGSIISVAFYASNKGLGAGIIATMSIGVFYILSYSQEISPQRSKWISSLPKIATIILITTISSKLGFLCFILLVFILLISIVKKNLSLKNIDDYFYYGIVPLAATLYIMSQYSILYGVFSASQILFILILVWIQTNRLETMNIDGK